MNKPQSWYRSIRILFCLTGSSSGVYTESWGFIGFFFYGCVAKQRGKGIVLLPFIYLFFCRVAIYLQKSSPCSPWLDKCLTDGGWQEMFNDVLALVDANPIHQKRKHTHGRRLCVLIPQHSSWMKLISPLALSISQISGWSPNNFQKSRGQTKNLVQCVGDKAAPSYGVSQQIGGGTQ